MDLSTNYLGFHLSSPLMPGSSPLVDELDTIRRLEDAGAAAIVMHSLFEEQIVGDEIAAYQARDVGGEAQGGEGEGGECVSFVAGSHAYPSPERGGW